jgi:hypothetical protein
MNGHATMARIHCAAKIVTGALSRQINGMRIMIPYSHTTASRGSDRMRSHGEKMKQLIMKTAGNSSASRLAAGDMWIPVGTHPGIFIGFPHCDVESE